MWTVFFTEGSDEKFQSRHDEARGAFYGDDDGDDNDDNICIGQIMQIIFSASNNPDAYTPRVVETMGTCEP